MEVDSIDLPLISKGDDIGKMIKNKADNPDLVAIASTIVSKSEGRTTKLDRYNPSERAYDIARDIDEDPRFIQIVLNSSKEVLIETPFLLCVTNFGHIAPNAGIDRSNVENGVLLLPENPNKSASLLSDKIGCPVIITDTCGRPFRNGQIGMAIGWHGFNALKDWRGEKDLYGKKLKITKEAIADEFAAASNLLMGEGKHGIPAVSFHNMSHILEDGNKSIFRDEKEDIIRQFLIEN